MNQAIKPAELAPQSAPIFVDMTEASAHLGISLNALRVRMTKFPEYLPGSFMYHGKRVWKREEFFAALEATIEEARNGTK